MKYYALILTKIILNFRKLKNRVAAQSSRDRKKARLDDLEAEVRNLREKVCAIHVYLYIFLSHTYITGTEKMHNFDFKFCHLCAALFNVYPSLYCESHYMFRRSCSSSGVQVVWSRKLPFCLFYCNCLWPFFFFFFYKSSRGSRQ